MATNINKNNLDDGGGERKIIITTDHINPTGGRLYVNTLNLPTILQALLKLRTDKNATGHKTIEIEETQTLSV